MKSELQAIRDALDAQDFDIARELADEYVTANPNDFTTLADLSLEECVKAVCVFRDAGMSDNHYQIEAWLLHKWEPQNIGGEASPSLRLAGK
jgi:hypothetical protein